MIPEMEGYHVPVLLRESVDWLNVRPDGVYVDVTFGGGGHSREILSRLTTGKLIAFDRDPDAAENIPADDRFIFVPKDYQFIENTLFELGFEEIDGILADLGVSSHQLDTASRGFSFRFDAPLDMRMDPSAPYTAADLLQNEDEESLARIFYRYGEIPNARKLARLIVKARQFAPLERTGPFEEAIRPCIPAAKRSAYLAQVFQALRIAVNEELVSIEALLPASLRLLRTGGRMVVIAYHSLEDRLVKNFFRSGKLDGKVEKDFYGNPYAPWEVLTRKPQRPSEEETIQNPRSRSARLRAAAKR